MAYLIYRSYSLTDYLKANDPRDDKKLFNFKNPVTKMLFVEDIYDGMAVNHNGTWSYNPGTQSLWDPLGLFHNEACTFSFMDGHAERKKWLDKRTIIYCNSREEAAAMGFGKGQVFSPPNEDLNWLDEHYPGKTNTKWGTDATVQHMPGREEVRLNVMGVVSMIGIDNKQVLGLN